VLRIFIIIPIYVAVMFLVPRTALFERIATAIRSTESSIVWHLYGYVCALVLSTALAWIIEYKWLPRASRYDALLRVMRTGLVGVIVASLFQLCAFFFVGGLGVDILLIPVAFIVGETAYEIVEYFRSLGAGRRNQPLFRRNMGD
jgi:hypothetical protein